MNYSYGPYNKFDNKEQWIRISEGCPNQCPYCYEPKEFKVFPIPEIVRNKVKIMDMNLLCKPESLGIIKELSNKFVNKKVVNYELICGIDYRFLTDGLAEALKVARFQNIRLAWDWGFNQQLKVKDGINKLLKAGYKNKDIMVFMICNWKIPISENFKKMDLCKVWNVKIADCYYDNQYGRNKKPFFWTADEIKLFRRKVRKHNQLIGFRCDPEYNNKQETLI